jgi:porin
MVWPGLSGAKKGLFTPVYQYEVRDGFTLQPNFQYITQLGRGATNPLGVNLPGNVLKDAAVFGLRTVLKF